jgi:hypothetical protein
VALLLALVACAVAAVLLVKGGDDPSSPGLAACLQGTRDNDSAQERERESGEREEQEREREEREREASEDGDRGGAGSEDAAIFAGPGEVQGGREGAPCGPRHPESFRDLALANSSRLARATAPGTRLKPGAYRSAIRTRSALASPASRRAVNGDGGQWKPYGNAPVETGRTEYDTTGGSTQQGLGDVAGRVSSVARATDGTLYAASANGGIFRSTDEAGSWTAISDTLPTQITSGVAWSSAGGGTLIALTGDNAFGGSSLGGLGVYRSTDEGKTWTHATGVPDGLLGFKLVVDPTDPAKVYAATGGGLFRSTDAGKSFTNVVLPTGKNAPAGTPDCSGKAPTVKDCFLANMVTDVVVQGAANSASAGGTPGAVVAAVGWRAGRKKNVDGSLQSPGNGVYRSATGAPGTFTNLDIAGHVTTTEGLSQAQLGRFALATADGPAQDHRILYGIISDAVKFNGGAAGIDVNDLTGQAVPNSDVLNGVYVSTDFGSTWKLLEGSTTIDADLTSGSALAPPTCKAPVIGYCPGVQGWYNLWVGVDPTKQTVAGVPTRVAFGLEEVWMSDQTLNLPLDGTTPQKFGVIGRYFAGSTCTLLTATNGLPVCPAAQGGTIPKTTTHPDQHASLFIPRPGGGVTLLVGNDGGVYKQTVDGSTPFGNDGWGTGANKGMHTTLPYDVAMAKDGTTYAGLQDNGEMKIDPDGRAYTIFGGDGFFSAVDPDHSEIAYEEYTNGGVSVTKDGGKTWKSIDPGLTSAQFATPFEMDPADANHLIIGGRDIQERLGGPDGSWAKVYDLGTQKHPGDAAAAAAKDDPDNQLSAVDVRSGAGTTSTAPAGPKTADVMYTGGASTIPDPSGMALNPLAYDDHEIVLAPGARNASMTVKVTWATSAFDWDLQVFRKAADGTLTEVGASQTSEPSEEVKLPNPAAGTYVVRVTNFAAAGTFDAAVTFTQQTGTASSDKRSAAYVGFCGYCDTITQGTPFGNGIATNVKDGRGGVAGMGDGWHIAAAKGLPSRLITSIRMDPADVNTVYVTLAGYGRRWAFPGAVGEDTSKVGTGHVFKSTDGAQSFTDITGDLPDTPANWSVVHKGQLVVGTDIGVFIGNSLSPCQYTVAGSGLPTAPIASLRLKPGDEDLLVAASYGRGIYTYRFPADAGPSACTSKAGGTSGAGGGTSDPASCATTAGFTSVKVTPKGRGLRFAVVRRVKRPFTVDVFQQAVGRRVTNERLVKRFTGRTGSFTWAGRTDRAGRRLKDGAYFARLTMSGPRLRDTRRAAFSGGARRFVSRRAFFAVAACRLLRTAKLSGPTWGGTTARALGVSFRLARPGAATVVIRRGLKVVRTVRFKAAGTRTHRVTLKARGARAGEYTVAITATAGGKSEKVALASRKL